MSHPNTKISVVIPLFNGGRFIAQALDSVFAQQLPATEVIVINDGSTDDGPEIVARYGNQNSIIVLHKPNGGQSSARNVGVDHARGDLIAFLDQDDVWYPNHLQALLAPFLEPRTIELGWSYSDLDEMCESGEIVTRSYLRTRTTEHPKRDIGSCLKHDMFVLPSASLISREVFRKVGGFDERLSGYEDDDLFLRILRAGFDNVYIAEPLSKWRVYQSSTSYTPRMAQSRMLYARKLLRYFPDNPTFDRFYSSDLIAPRFLRHVVDDARIALRTGKLEFIDAYLEEISFLESHISSVRKVFPLRRDLLISTIIPLYNGAPFIREAIQSILDQELTPDEIIVVDDGSTDDGPDIVAEMATRAPIRLLRKENGGQSSARNLGVDHAHGDLIAFLDQDDVWYPNHLTELLKPFLETRGVELGWSYSDLDEITRSGKMVTRFFLRTQDAEHPKRDVASCLEHDMFILPSASLISRKAFRDVGGFDERLSGYEDDDLFIRILQAGFDNVYIDEPLSKWRIYPSSTSYSPRMAQSRMHYARKLLQYFPDNPSFGRFYSSDRIVLRFLGHVVDDARAALRMGTMENIDVHLQEISFLESHLSSVRKVFPLRQNMLISAIVPLYNGAPFIREAIQSILDQELTPDEIIVVDDGSTDDGPAIVADMAKGFPIRLLRKENGGQSSARNLGVDHAHGDLIAFLDQDDVWYPNHLRVLFAAFLETRAVELGWSYSNLDEINESGEVVTRSFLRTRMAEHPKRDIESCLEHDMFVLPSASLISRKAFRDVGGFDERLSGYEDDDLFLRILQAGFDNVYVDEPLSKWRIYWSSTSYSPRMAISRAIYARKLIGKFPDDPERSRYYVRNLIAPRFFRTMMWELRKATLKGTGQQQRTALDNLRFIIRHLSLRRRISLELFFVPVFHIRPIAYFVMHRRLIFHNIFRRIMNTPAPPPASFCSSPVGTRKTQHVNLDHEWAPLDGRVD